MPDLEEADEDDPDMPALEEMTDEDMPSLKEMTDEDDPDMPALEEADEDDPDMPALEPMKAAVRKQKSVHPYIWMRDSIKSIFAPYSSN
jgi:hypothetical protein